MEVVEEFSGSNHHGAIVMKKKRTKRSSSSSSSTTSAGGEFTRTSLLSSSSPASSSNCSEEDEDMANCLILLARSAGFGCRFSPDDAVKVVSSGGGGGAYDCKTCGRSFASFQALGGHRASHKKPKIPPPPPLSSAVDRKKSPPIKEKLGELNTIDPPIPTPLLETKSKTHECSICGSEFGSGQALGGHMRRHRPVAATGRNEHLSPPPPEKTRSVLALDLNLPAPPEDDRKAAESDQYSTNQPRLLFSSTALVDCHN